MKKCPLWSPAVVICNCEGLGKNGCVCVHNTDSLSLPPGLGFVFLKKLMTVNLVRKFYGFLGVASDVRLDKICNVPHARRSPWSEPDLTLCRLCWGRGE